MEKHFTCPGSTAGGFPFIHRIEPGTLHGIGETDGLCKTASKEHLPEVMELVESLQAKPDRLYLLNSALGAGEKVGFNLRGDWFTEEGLLHEPKGWERTPVWDIDGRRQLANSTEKVGGWGKLAWGYPTFYNAHKFRHHVNKDPDRAYGFVLGAFWDPRMRRVILVSELLKEQCDRLGASDLYERIANGEFPDTSMGAKVPYDRCAICGHTARTPAQYCKHVEKGAVHPYGMGNLLDDGRRCGVYNDYPRFFDDSYVFIGAERSAKNMSNLTDRVRGERPYSRKVYRFQAPMSKAASAEEEHALPGDERADFDLETKLNEVMKQIPAASPRERAILSFLIEMRLADNAVKKGVMSEGEKTLLELISGRKLEREHGVARSSMDYLEKILDTKFKSIYGGHGKKASSKWAEMLKEVPAPTIGVATDMTDVGRQLPSLSKKQLNAMSESPTETLKAAAAIGVVLRPAEFQHIILKQANAEMLEDLEQKGEVFAPQPLDPEHESSFDYRDGITDQMISGMREMLEEVTTNGLPFLLQRSFAPQACRIRMVETIDVDKPDAEPEEVRTPTLDKVSHLYNEYRCGLLANKPDWRGVDTPHLGGDLLDEEKLAVAAYETSDLLLCLAYWPAMRVG